MSFIYSNACFLVNQFFNIYTYIYILYILYTAFSHKVLKILIVSLVKNQLLNRRNRKKFTVRLTIKIQESKNLMIKNPIFTTIFCFNSLKSFNFMGGKLFFYVIYRQTIYWTTFHWSFGFSSIDDISPTNTSYHIKRLNET
jgi:hypothetical protein